MSIFSLQRLKIENRAKWSNAQKFEAQWGEIWGESIPKLPCSCTVAETGTGRKWRNSGDSFLIFLLLQCSLYFEACSLPRFFPSRDLLVTYDWANQTQSAFLECVAPSAGGVNSFRPCFLSKILLKIVSVAIRIGKYCINFALISPLESPPFTRISSIHPWGNSLQVDNHSNCGFSSRWILQRSLWYILVSTHSD